MRWEDPTGDRRHSSLTVSGKTGPQGLGELPGLLPDVSQTPRIRSSLLDLPTWSPSGDSIDARPSPILGNLLSASYVGARRGYRGRSDYLERELRSVCDYHVETAGRENLALAKRSRITSDNNASCRASRVSPLPSSCGSSTVTI